MPYKGAGCSRWCCVHHSHQSHSEFVILYTHTMATFHRLSIGLLLAIPAAVSAAADELAPRGLNVPTVNNWAYQGCWIDSVSNRTLSGGTYVANSSMTIETCLSVCFNGPYLYGGVEYGGECYCARSLLPGTTAQNETGCNMACRGDATEACGGSNRLSLYKNTAYSGPAIAPGSSGYTYAGCFNDSVSARTLSNSLKITNLTVESCLSACSVQGFKYAGVEYSSECYCGNTLQNNGALAADGESKCSMVCDGNKLELCGGSGRLNMYMASSSPTGTPSSPVQGLATGWTSQGCFNDTVANRTLSSIAMIPGNGKNMTVEICVNTCAAQGFSIAGLEYAGECFCDTQLRNGGAPATDGCYMPCTGNSSETCGGPNRLNVYSNYTLWDGPAGIQPLTSWSVYAYQTAATFTPTSNGVNSGIVALSANNSGFMWMSPSGTFSQNVTGAPFASYDVVVDIKIDQMANFSSCSMSMYVDDTVQMFNFYANSVNTTYTRVKSVFWARDATTIMRVNFNCNWAGNAASGNVAFNIGNFKIIPRSDNVNVVANPGFESSDASPWVYAAGPSPATTSFQITSSNPMYGSNSALFTFSQPAGTQAYNYDALSQIATGLVVGQKYIAICKFKGIAYPAPGNLVVEMNLKDPNSTSWITQYPYTVNYQSVVTMSYTFVAPSTYLYISVGTGVYNPRGSGAYQTLVDSVLVMPFYAY